MKSRRIRRGENLMCLANGIQEKRSCARMSLVAESEIWLSKIPSTGEKIINVQTSELGSSPAEQASVFLAVKVVYK
jgi:hypothetical protein